MHLSFKQIRYIGLRRMTPHKSKYRLQRNHMYSSVFQCNYRPISSRMYSIYQYSANVSIVKHRRRDTTRGQDIKCEIAEVYVRRRMRKLLAEDAANGHLVLQLCRCNILVHFGLRRLALSGQLRCKYLMHNVSVF